MPKILGDNLLYRGQQPNFERDQFKTLAQMRAYNKAWLDDGHIAFCLEDKQHYAWNATANEWQLFTPSGVVKAEDTDEIVEDIEPNIVGKMRALEYAQANMENTVKQFNNDTTQRVNALGQDIASMQEQVTQADDRLAELEENVTSFHPKGMPTSGTWEERPTEQGHDTPDGYCYLLRSETPLPDNPSVIVVSYLPIFYSADMKLWYDATGTARY